MKTIIYEPMINSETTMQEIRSKSIDELYRIDKEEQELNRLNHRFATYLNTIIHLGEINIHLRQQIDEIRGNYLENTGNPFAKQRKIIQRDMNIELDKLTHVQTRFQRATHDKQYYRNQLQLFSTTDHQSAMQQQLNANLYELNLLKNQHKHQLADLQFCKNEYEEYGRKLLQCTSEYNRIVSECMQSEHHLCTLREQFVFEREKNTRCREEWEFLEKLQDDLNDQFTKKELANILQKIRQDYQNYNQIQLSELEVFYKIKYESIESYFNRDSKEDIKPLIEENRQLQEKLKRLEDEFRQMSEENQRKCEVLNEECRRIEIQLPEFQTSIENSRDNTVYLTSEINTYRGLLKNLVEKPRCRTTDFTVHFGNGIIWCRI